MRKHRQIVLAVLLASATATTFLGRRANKACTFPDNCFDLEITERAPCMSSVRRWTSGTVIIFVCKALKARFAADQNQTLCDWSGESIFVKNSKLIHCGFPVMSRVTPVCSDVLQGQPDHLGRGFV